MDADEYGKSEEDRSSGKAVACGVAPSIANDGKAKSEDNAKRPNRTFTRRGFVTGLVGGIVGGAVAGSGVACAVDGYLDNDNRPGGRAYTRIDLKRAQPYYDLDHPSGITDASQRYTAFVMFDMNKGASRKDLQLLLARWTAACGIMQTGKPLGDIRPAFSESTVPKDVGEAVGVDPSSLTIVIGFGPSLFDDRFGTASFKPEKLVEYKRITGETLLKKPGSDLGVQVCADDRQVIFHAVRSLGKLASGTASMTYVHQGFKPFRQSPDQPTPRDLFGFREGTNNPTDPEDFDQYVWVKGGDQAWLEGGAYLAYSRTVTYIEPWENDRISDQEEMIGRAKDTGAPLSNPEGSEFDDPDFAAKDEDGNYLIDPNSHSAITSHQRLGFKVLRRSYNYWSGLNEHGGQDAGMLNVLYIQDPHQFFKLRDDMGKYDRLNEYYYDDYRGLYAVPHAPATGTYLGQEFFE